MPCLLFEGSSVLSSKVELFWNIGIFCLIPFLMPVGVISGSVAIFVEQ